MSKKHARYKGGIEVITPDIVGRWKSPQFQRELRINNKVRELVEEIREEQGVIPGALTLGIFGKERYLLDGQHRREAFLLSGCAEGLADIRICEFESMDDMGAEFVRLNSQLVTLRPDDVLRGMEGTSDVLKMIRHYCDFVGYDRTRRSSHAPFLSMSMVIKMWIGAGFDVPRSAGGSALDALHSLTKDDAHNLCEFLNTCKKAWGTDPEYARLWSALNLAIVAWLWRHTVIKSYSHKVIQIPKLLFEKCLMSISADPAYTDWLYGRVLRDRDRAPAYQRIKALLAKRILDETGKKALLPAPEWERWGGMQGVV